MESLLRAQVGVAVGAPPRRLTSTVAAICRHRFSRSRSLDGGSRFLAVPPLPSAINVCTRIRAGQTNEEGECEISGTVFGAVSLIIGTSIGSGMLALPQKTSQTGFVPSAVFMAACWGFLVLEALLLVEVNVTLMRERRKDGGGPPEVISFRTMAEETLGEWGAHTATLAYVFLAYTSTTAYAAKAGELLSRVVALPTPVSGALFTLLHAALIVVGGASTTDRVNQWLTASMLSLLAGVELLSLGRPWAGLDGAADWGQVPSTVPVIIFSLVYHDVAPVICSYLGGDLPRIRASLLIGSAVPLISLLAWDSILLGFSPDASGAADPFDLFMRGTGDAMALMVGAFSLLAVGTSLIGTLLGFSHFFREQLRKVQGEEEEERDIGAAGALQLEARGSRRRILENWWAGNNINMGAMSMAVVPALLVSSTVPDAFYLATDIAGGYCMTILYGILPPAMAWAMHARKARGKAAASIRAAEGLSESRPALIGVGLCAFGIVVDQMLQDLSPFNLHL